MSFKKKKKPLPDVGPSYDDGKLSFSGREEMDGRTAIASAFFMMRERGQARRHFDGRKLVAQGDCWRPKRCKTQT